MQIYTKYIQLDIAKDSLSELHTLTVVGNLSHMLEEYSAEKL